MLRSFCCAFILFNLLQYVTASQNKFSRFCKNNTMSLSCNTQLAGQQATESDVCKVENYPPNSQECKYMKFGPLNSNVYIGGVSLKPYLLDEHHQSYNYTVLNITFTNIKWKTMKFRFQPTTFNMNHCRNIVLSNDVKIDERSVLYYDCYWSLTNGDYNNTSHILDFEASDDKQVYRGQYYFNIPNAQMLSPFVTEREWKPFLYIEILPGTLRLRAMPPPARLRVRGYSVQVRRGCPPPQPCEDRQLAREVLLLNNYTEVTYDFYFLGTSGFYYFVVTPLHDDCPTGEQKLCQVVASPKITISNEEHKALNICIASVTALVVATLFAYYIVLRVIRRYWCKDYSLAMGNEIPAPTKVLVIYPPSSRLHSECVASFVAYLRSECGLDVSYDGDVAATAHGDPYAWAAGAARVCTHVVYAVGPQRDAAVYTDIYEKPVNAHKDVDILLLSMIKASITTKCPKHVANVFFEHSNGPVPIETKFGEKFYLLRDWQKLISYLSMNLLPKKTIMRTEKGRCFMEDLNKAKKMLGGRNDGKCLV